MQQVEVISDGSDPLDDDMDFEDKVCISWHLYCSGLYVL